MSDFANSVAPDFANSVAPQLTWEGNFPQLASVVSESVAGAAQAYPALGEFYTFAVSTAKDLYANPPSVDESYDRTFATMMSTAPWMYSQVERIGGLFMDTIP